MKLLDSLREQYTRYQEVCRQRSKRTQLEEIQQKVMQVVNWLEGPGSEQLRAQWGIGDSIRASQALQQKHEEIESQHSEWFAVYVELNQQIAALLNAGDEEDLVELKSLQQQLSDVCYRQASQLEFRQNLLQAALEFHGVAQDLSQQLDGLLGMLCVDVAPADGASIQQTLKLLEEKLKSVVEWLSELLDALLKTHIRLGDDAQETKVLLEKHRKFVDVAQSTYDYGRQLLQATVVLCQSLRCTSRSSGDTLPRLNRVWKQFTIASEERVHRLEMAIAFHSNAEKILQDCPEEPEAINDEEQFDEIEAVGKSLLDRLTVPVVYPDGFFWKGPQFKSASTNTLGYEPPGRDWLTNSHVTYPGLLMAMTEKIKETVQILFNSYALKPKQSVDADAKSTCGLWVTEDTAKPSSHPVQVLVTSSSFRTFSAIIAFHVGSTTRCGKWVQLQLAESQPNLLEIGSSQDEAKKLLHDHELLLAKLKPYPCPGPQLQGEFFLEQRSSSLNNYALKCTPKSMQELSWKRVFQLTVSIFRRSEGDCVTQLVILGEEVATMGKPQGPSLQTLNARGLQVLCFLCSR
ncbi:hypothetical protein CB1_000644025 [Camelus ferus]|nr:hypothetical protein CB1_000644025 [Camelus ferus]